MRGEWGKMPTLRNLLYPLLNDKANNNKILFIKQYNILAMYEHLFECGTRSFRLYLSEKHDEKHS